MSKVSVVIPCYRGAKWIEGCVESVLRQDHEDLEVLVVDDASPDDSAEIVRGIDDERVRLLRHDVNEGVAGARNTGIEAATGDYVGFLDQDDRWHADKLARQVAVFEDGPADLGVVHGDVEVAGPVEKESWGGPLPDDPRLRVRELFLRHPIITITALFDAACFETHGLLDESLYGSDDYEFLLRIAEDYRIEYLPEVLATKRIHETNTSDDFVRMNQDKVVIAERYLAEYPYLRPLRDRKYHQIMTHYARSYAAEGNYARAVEYDLRALGYVKTHPSDYLRFGRDVAAAGGQLVGGFLARVAHFQ